MNPRSLARRLLLGKPPASQWKRLEAEGLVAAGIGTYGTELLRIHEFRLPDGRWIGSDLRIGKYCSIASGVQVFLGGNHNFEWVTQYPFPSFWNLPERESDAYNNGPIVIGNDVWIGTDAKLMSGVTIGDGAVVAAGAVVTKDIAPYTVVGGVPAKPIRLRFDQETVTRVRELRWWDWPEADLRANADLLLAPPAPREADTEPTS